MRATALARWLSRHVGVGPVPLMLEGAPRKMRSHLGERFYELSVGFAGIEAIVKVMGLEGDPLRWHQSTASIGTDRRRHVRRT